MHLIGIASKGAESTNGSNIVGVGGDCTGA